MRLAGLVLKGGMRLMIGIVRGCKGPSLLLSCVRRPGTSVVMSSRVCSAVTPSSKEMWPFQDARTNKAARHVPRSHNSCCST